MVAVAARRLAVDRNPLWTWPERLRVWVTIAAGVLVVLAAPLVAGPVMDQAYPAVAHQARVQAIHAHRVSAVLLADAVPAVPTIGAPSSARVPARWTGPDGRTHQQTIDVTRRIPAGRHMPIWVDDHGRPTPAPLTPSQVDGRVTALGGIAVLGLIVVIGLAVWLFRRWVDRRGYARWELQWAVTEPQWTRRS